MPRNSNSAWGAPAWKSPRGPDCTATAISRLVGRSAFQKEQLLAVAPPAWLSASAAGRPKLSTGPGRKERDGRTLHFVRIRWKHRRANGRPARAGPGFPLASVPWNLIGFLSLDLLSGSGRYQISPWPLGSVSV